MPPAKLKVARFLARHAPWVTLQGNLNAELLTRDPEIQQEHRTDPLRHSRMSAPLFFGMIEGGAMLMERAAEIQDTGPHAAGRAGHRHRPRGRARSSSTASAATTRPCRFIPR